LSKRVKNSQSRNKFDTYIVSAHRNKRWYIFSHTKPQHYHHKVWAGQARTYKPIYKVYTKKLRLKMDWKNIYFYLMSDWDGYFVSFTLYYLDKISGNATDIVRFIFCPQCDVSPRCGSSWVAMRVPLALVIFRAKKIKSDNKNKVCFFLMFFWHDPKEPKVLAKYRLANWLNRAIQYLSTERLRYGELGLLLGKNTEKRRSLKHIYLAG